MTAPLVLLGLQILLISIRNRGRGSRMTRWISLASASVGTTLAASALAFAGDGKEQIKLTAADQAAAQAVVLRRSDLGSTGWQGGATKPNLSSGISCPNFHPKVSDLVITGAAETSFRRSTLVFGNLIVILRTRRMVALDWRRSFLAPGAIACLRQTMSDALGSSGKLVSFRKLAFPGVTSRTAVFRAVISVKAGGKAVRVLTDLVFVAKSRTEITLNVAAPASAAKAVSAAERRIVRTLVTRARA
jgi:hypothetical protein